MKYRLRIFYSAAQRAEIWHRWQRGGKAMAIAFTLIETAKLNGVDP